MTTTLPAFTPLEDSLWLTLCGRALDNRSPRPVLGDATSDQIVRTLDYDYKKLNIDTNFRLSVALRARSWTGWSPTSWYATRTRWCSTSASGSTRDTHG